MKHIVWLFMPLFFLVVSEGAAQSRLLRYAPPLRSWRAAVEVGVGVLGDDNTRDSKDYHFRPVAGIELAKQLNHYIAVGMYGNGGMLRSSTSNREAGSSFMSTGLLTEFHSPLLRGRLYPLLQIRGGIIMIAPELRIDETIMSESLQLHFAWSLAVGMEVISDRRFGVRVLSGVTYTSTDNWDLLVKGNDRDGFSFVQIGVTWYFGSGRR